MKTSFITLVWWMAREEFRFHARLFGGGRFLGFPAMIALLIGLSVFLLEYIGVELTGIIFSVHLLVLLFGLQTGALGLTGQDALENLLGDVTFLIYSSRTLPITQRTLLAAFFIKDLGYYALILTLPATIGFAVVLPLSVLPLLFISLTGMFGLGIVLTLLGLSLPSSDLSYRLIGVLALGILALVWMNGIDLLQFTPYGFFVDQTVISAVTGFAPTVALAGVVFVTFEPRSSTGIQTYSNQFTQFARVLPERTGPIAGKTLIDVQRSNGGVLTLVLSVSLLFGVSLYMIQIIETATGLLVPVGLTLSALLSLASFLVYTWLVQFDSVEEYTFLPLGINDVMDGKALAFTLVAYPTALLHYMLGVLALGTSISDGLIGAAMLVSLMVYFFGLTVYLTGFSPNEFLFDVVRFSAFGVGLMLPLVPLLVVALVSPAYTTTNSALLLLFGGCFAAMGLLLQKLSVRKWSQMLR